MSTPETAEPLFMECPQKADGMDDMLLFCVTANTLDIWETAVELFRRHHTGREPVRSLSVKTGSLAVLNQLGNPSAPVPVLPPVPDAPMFRWGTNSAALAASCSGDTSTVGIPLSPAIEISWFWQKGQRRLQPKLPTDKIRLPGWNRRRGFFAMGSRAKLVSFP